MKLKTLRKKIRRLEARLQEGAKKLAKMKRKLAATTTADAKKAKKKGRRSIVKSQVRPPSVPKPGAAKKVKRKLNLSPERRAQLAASMKARWAAKRAAANANTQNPSTEQGFAPGQGSHPQ